MARMEKAGFGVGRKRNRRGGSGGQLAEELERRVMLASAIAAFAPQVTFGVGAQPRAVATADVNLDGKLDLVVTNGSAVGVLLGNGSGGFGTQTTFLAGTTPFGVAVADVNRDGKLDLVTANNGSGNVSVLLGNGNGTFLGQQTFAAGTQARFVSVADVNGDGKPDLVVANYGAGTVSVLLGNGNGTFGGQTTFSAGTQPSSIAVGDFNRDGKLDLAVADKSVGTVSVLLGNGNGVFGARSTFGAGTLPFSIASGDVNGDGKLDLVVAEETNGVVGVLLGNGSGGFSAQTTFGVGSIPAAVVVSDVNGDGKLDIAAANYSSNSVSVLLGNGNGSFATHKTVGVGTSPFSIAAGDVNRDGRVDLVVGDFGGSSLSVLAGDVLPYVVSINRSNPNSQSAVAPSVTFAVNFNEAVTGVDATDFALALSGVTTSTPVVVSGGPAVYSVTVNGISGTGTLGLNLVDNGSIHDLAGNALQSAGFSLAPQQTVATAIHPDSVVISDLNRDGKADLFLDSPGPSVVLGNGNGTFGSPTTYVTSHSNGGSVADVNGDGKLDLVLAGSTNFSAGPPPGVMLGNGDGTFQNEVTFSGGVQPVAVATADLDGDGKLDLIVGSTSFTAGTVGVLLGNGDGSFKAMTTFDEGTYGRTVLAADVNGDGKADVLVVNTNGTVSVLLGNGNGSLAARTTVAAGTSPAGLALGDFNGDGLLDLVVGNIGSSVNVMLGNGNGTFGAAQALPAGINPMSVAVTDINGDGNLDLVVANYKYENSASNISVLLGNGNGTFVGQLTFAVGNQPSSVAVADLNGDGRTDVVVGNFANGTAGILLRTVSDGSFTGQTYTIVPNMQPAVTGVARSNPAGLTATGAAVSYAVSFNEAVTGVDATDFRVVTSGGVTAAGPVNVTGSGAGYTVTVNGIHGSGTVELDLIDDDSIKSGSLSLGGSGAANGSFQGQRYTVLQGGPQVVSINRLSPSGPSTGASSVQYQVQFSKSVTGVDPADFQVVSSAGVTSGAVQVSGGGTLYTVTVNGISGSGSLGLNLVDDGSIRDSSGNPLSGGSAGTALAAPVVTPTNRAPLGMSVGDVNGDGKPDVVTADFYTHVLAVMLGNGDGTLSAQKTFSAGPYPKSIAIVDVNGDGKADLTVAVNTGGVSVLLGNGDGTFGAQQTFATGTTPRGAAAADLNGDGKPDLAVANLSTDNVSILLGNGDGTFKSQVTYAAGDSPIDAVVTDLNGDGKPDLVVIDWHTFGGLSILMGNGNGTFKAATSFLTGDDPNSVSVSDMNGDGKLDILVSNQNSYDVGVLVGNGDGTFQEQQTFVLTYASSAVVAADLNGDGMPDAVTANFVGGGYLLGNGDGTLRAEMTIAADVANGTFGIGSADLNGDGRVDVVVSNRVANDVSVLVNKTAGNFAGQTYTIVGLSDTVNGTAGVDQLTLKRDADNAHIDWTLGTTSGQMLINDANGLTINGNGGNDVITLDYSNGSPLPNLLKVNQPQGGTPAVNTVTINGLDSSHLLSGTTIDINTSKVFIKYAGAGVDPVASIMAYLASGRGANTWAGTAVPGGGAIRSSAAALNPNLFAIGYADSGDGSGVNGTANSVELMYTIGADANLDGQVSLADFGMLTGGFGNGTRWTQGDFNYDQQVSLADLGILTSTFGQSLATAGGPAMSSAAVSTATTDGAAQGGRVVASTAEAMNAGAGTEITQDSSVDWVGGGKKKRNGRR